MNHIFIKAAFGKKVNRIPIWIMRQAGRYMKEYQALRAKYSFLELCKNPEQACKVTLLPIDLLDVDAAILFSDILIPIEAMGLNLNFTDEGPKFSKPIKTKKDIDSLIIPHPEEKLSFVLNSIKLVKQELNNKVPLIGFSGAPFTLMSYMVEGGTSKDLKLTKQLIYSKPELAKQLLNKITDTTILYLNAQISAGAQAIQIFDTWAGLLPHNHFLEYSIKYIKKVISKLNRQNIPIIVFAKGSSIFYNELLNTNADVISIDWNAKLSNIKNNIGDKAALQGNLDPYILYADKNTIAKYTKELIDSMSAFDGYIFNLGHGILPDIPFDNVKFLVDYVKQIGMKNE